MKKFFIALVAVFAMSTMASAQIQTLGVRVGGGQGYGAELSAQWGFMGQRLETDLGWNSGDHYTGFSLAGIYQWTGEIGSGFSWYAGVGARLAMWSWESGYKDHDSDFALALVGQAGIEYNFDAIPFQLSLDIRPNFWLIPDTDFHWGDIALGIRYRF
ncbi:MAG: hypothetical protein IJ634_03045 [Bacteroidales bacterium]|nr:hypothetical protein [Bacteroidales bacterium]